jgi:hypothetical protein
MYRKLVEMPEGKRNLRDLNIDDRKILKINSTRVYVIHLFQDKDQLWAPVNMVTRLYVPKKASSLSDL